MMLDTDMSIADEFESDFHDFFRSMATKYNLDSDKVHEAISDLLSGYELSKTLREWKRIKNQNASRDFKTQW